MLTRSIRHTVQLAIFLSICFVASLSPTLSRETAILSPPLSGGTAILDQTRLVTGGLEVGRAVPGLFGGRLYDGFSRVGVYEAVFDLKGEFDALEFSFGSEDTKAYDSVTLQFSGDGRQLASFTHRKGNPPIKVALSVSGVRALKWQCERSFAATELLLRKGPPPEPKPLEVEDGQVITLEAGTYKIVVKGVIPPTATTPLFGIPGGRSLPVDPRDIGDLAGKLKGQVSADAVLGGLLSSGEKVQVAVAPFLLIPNDLSTTVSATVTELLSTELIKSGAFKLIERAQLDKVLEELGFQQTGVVDPETAKQIGKITGAATVMIGSVIDQGTYAVITCRLINTETGEATIADSVELRK